MKIEYVYQSTEQLRNADALTLQAPPQRVTLALNGCPVDDRDSARWRPLKGDQRGGEITKKTRSTPGCCPHELLGNY